MRIGGFSEKFGQSIDTIRHYMELNLIIPEKTGGQYRFDEACERDLVRILYFKERGFSLQEVKTILYYERLGRLTEHQHHCCYTELVRNKYRAVMKRIEDLNSMKELLEESLSVLEDQKAEKRFALGLDISTIGMIACHQCGGTLTLQDAHIVDNQIMLGSLACACGSSCKVKDGILVVPGTCRVSEEQYDISDYLQQTNPDYLDSIYRGLEWTHRRAGISEASGKVFLELGCGIGFFLRHNHKDLPESAIYMAVDRDISSLRYLKDMLERSDVKRRIIFICSDFRAMPVCRGSVDILVDHSGTSNFGFENSDFLVGEVMPWLKPEATLLGTYICFNKFGKKNPLSMEQRKLFTDTYISSALERLGFELSGEDRSAPIYGGGPYEDFFHGDESVYRYTTIAEKK